MWGQSYNSILLPCGRGVEYAHRIPACRMRRLKGCLDASASLAWKVDIFSFHWPNNIYVFPPLNFKSNEQNLVWWSRRCRIYYPCLEIFIYLTSLLDLLIEYPIFIPSHQLARLLPTGVHGHRHGGALAPPSPGISKLLLLLFISVICITYEGYKYYALMNL